VRYGRLHGRPRLAQIGGYRAPLTVDVAGRCTIDVDDAVADEVRFAHRDRVTGTDDADLLDAHAGLNRLKLAAVLGIVDGRLSVTPAEWALAEVIATAFSLFPQQYRRQLRKSKSQPFVAYPRDTAEESRVEDV